jgi:hypothetical protein
MYYLTQLHHIYEYWVNLVEHYHFKRTRGMGENICTTYFKLNRNPPCNKPEYINILSQYLTFVVANGIS